MRNFSGLKSFGPAVLLVLTVSLAACGGNKTSTNTANIPVSVAISPSPISMTTGSTGAFDIIVKNSAGSTLGSFYTVAIASSNTGVATAVVPSLTSGLLCAGTFDANGVRCTAGPVGTSDITVTVTSTVDKTTVTSAPVTVYVHKRVDRVDITPANVDCLSQTVTQQFAAKAFSQGVDITPTVGVVTWISINTEVTKFDDAGTGLATAVQPGITNVYASAGGVNSLPTQFITCPPAQIKVHVRDLTDTSMTVDAGLSKDFVADVIDTKGAAMSNLRLVWTSTLPTAAGVSAGTASTTIAGVSEVVASCTPQVIATGTPPCINGLTWASYSNVGTVNVNGTGADSTVYATGTDALKIVPIDTSNNTVGTAITLPYKPNSILINNRGTRVFMGGDKLMYFDVTDNIVRTAEVTGKVVAVGTDGFTVLVADAVNNKIFLVGTSNAAAPASISTTATGMVAGDINVDTVRSYFVGTTTLNSYSTIYGFSTVALSATARDVTMLANGALGYLAGGAASGVNVYATCNNAFVTTVGVSSDPLLIKTLPNGTQVLAVTNSGIDAIAPTVGASPATSCPPSVSHTVAPHSFNAGTFTPRQLIVSYDSAKALVTNETNKLFLYDTATGNVTAITLAGGATESFTGGVMQNNKIAFVGAGGVTAVHRIDLTTGADVTQIAVDFIPNLVAVRPK